MAWSTYAVAHSICVHHTINNFVHKTAERRHDDEVVEGKKIKQKDINSKHIGIQNTKRTTIDKTRKRIEQYGNWLSEWNVQNARIRFVAAFQCT